MSRGQGGRCKVSRGQEQGEQEQGAREQELCDQISENGEQNL